MQAEGTKQTAQPICAFIELAMVQQALLSINATRSKAAGGRNSQIVEYGIGHALLQRYLLELGYLYPLSYHGYKLIVRTDSGSFLHSMNETAASYLRESLAVTPFHQWLRSELRDVDAKNGRVVIDLPVRPEFWRDPRRPEIQGGVIAAFIDIAGHAVIAARFRQGVSTIDLRIDYELVATAEPGKIGRIDVRVTDEHGKLVATGRGLFSTRAG